MIVVVDYGVGNIAALLNMYDHLGIDCCASGEAAVIAQAEKLLLPGVGAFDRAMSALRQRELVEPLNHAVRERCVPVLGICLGMQLLAERSEEGVEPGLGWIPADVVEFAGAQDAGLKVPHVGWSNVQPVRESPLFPKGAAGDVERFYFTHSYHMRCHVDEDVAAVIDYGGQIVCAVSRCNIYGAQFHPEKSHRFGMRVLTAFADI